MTRCNYSSRTRLFIRYYQEIPFLVTEGKVECLLRCNFYELSMQDCSYLVNRLPVALAWILPRSLSHNFSKKIMPCILESYSANITCVAGCYGIGVSFIWW